MAYFFRIDNFPLRLRLDSKDLETGKRGKNKSPVDTSYYRFDPHDKSIEVIAAIQTVDLRIWRIGAALIGEGSSRCLRMWAKAQPDGLVNGGSYMGRGLGTAENKFCSRDSSLRRALRRGSPSSRMASLVKVTTGSCV